MDLSIIILTWNTRDYLKKCLDSICETVKEIRYEVIVVDNASGDDTVQMVEEKYPDVILIRNYKNIGMPARNQGLKIAKGRFLFLLDVDTIVLPGAVNLLVDYLAKNPDVGLVASKLVYLNGDLAYTCRKFPTVMSKLSRRIPAKWAQSLLEKEELRYWSYNSARETDYVIGACQMVRREAHERVGMFDEKIFYGPDDVDYCLRVWQKGFKVVYNPEATIIHVGRRITRGKLLSKVSCRHLHSMAYYFFKHRYLFSRKRLYRSFRYTQETP